MSDHEKTQHLGSDAAKTEHQFNEWHAERLELMVRCLNIPLKLTLRGRRLIVAGPPPGRRYRRRLTTATYESAQSPFHVLCWKTAAASSLRLAFLGPSGALERLLGWRATGRTSDSPLFYAPKGLDRSLHRS